jgi:hypothetical protein
LNNGVDLDKEISKLTKMSILNSKNPYEDMSEEIPITSLKKYISLKDLINISTKERTEIKSSEIIKDVPK